MAGRRLLNLVVAATLLLGAAACKRGSGAEGGSDTTRPTGVETVPTVPTTPTSTTGVPSYEVPEVIDRAYVERVMKALDHVYGDAIRIMARDRQLSDEFLNHLLAIYTTEQFELTQTVWMRDLAEGLRGLDPSARDPVTRVQRIVRATNECIVAAVERDFSATRTLAQQSTPQHYIGLVPELEGKDRLKVNPTPWMLSFDGWVESGAEPQRPCVRE